MGKILYHFTSGYHLEKILESGYLKLTESNLQLTKDWDIVAYNQGKQKLYKPVVWLTDKAEEDAVGMGLESSKVDKTSIRIAIKKQPYHKKWSKWRREQGMDTAWAKEMERGRAPKTWWVSEITIGVKDFLEVVDMRTGEKIEVPEP